MIHGAPRAVWAYAGLEDKGGNGRGRGGYSISWLCQYSSLAGVTLSMLLNCLFSMGRPRRDAIYTFEASWGRRIYGRRRRRAALTLVHAVSGREPVIGPRIVPRRPRSGGRARDPGRNAAPYADRQHPIGRAVDGCPAVAGGGRRIGGPDGLGWLRITRGMHSVCVFPDGGAGPARKISSKVYNQVACDPD